MTEYAAGLDPMEPWTAKATFATSGSALPAPPQWSRESVIAPVRCRARRVIYRDERHTFVAEVFSLDNHTLDVGDSITVYAIPTGGGALGLSCVTSGASEPVFETFINAVADLGEDADYFEYATSAYGNFYFEALAVFEESRAPDPAP